MPIIKAILTGPVKWNGKSPVRSGEQRYWCVRASIYIYIYKSPIANRVIEMGLRALETSKWSLIQNKLLSSKSNWFSASRTWHTSPSKSSLWNSTPSTQLLNRCPLPPAELFQILVSRSTPPFFTKSLNDQSPHRSFHPKLFFSIASHKNRFFPPASSSPVSCLN